MQQTWEREQTVGEENTLVKDMQKELKKNRMKRAVAEADVVLLPICQDNHWTLIEIDAGCKRLYVYDSQVPADVEGREKRKATASKVLEWYRDEGDMEWDSGIVEAEVVVKDGRIVE